MLSTLKSHFARAHLEGLACPVCGFEARSPAGLRNHIRQCHPEIAPLACRVGPDYDPPRAPEGCMSVREFHEALGRLGVSVPREKVYQKLREGALRKVVVDGRVFVPRGELARVEYLHRLALLDAAEVLREAIARVDRAIAIVEQVSGIPKGGGHNEVAGLYRRLRTLRKGLARLANRLEGLDRRLNEG